MGTGDGRYSPCGEFGVASSQTLSPCGAAVLPGQAGGFLSLLMLFGLSLQSGQFNEDMIPTVGFNMRKITKGNVTIKVRCRRYLQCGLLG